MKTTLLQVVLIVAFNFLQGGKAPFILSFIDRNFELSSRRFLISSFRPAQVMLNFVAGGNRTRITRVEIKDTDLLTTTETLMV